MYDFDKIIDRRNTRSTKWDSKVLEERFGSSDILPLWIADMDFEVAPAIKEAVTEVSQHGIYGYTEAGDANVALSNWMKKRHNADVDSEHVLNTPGVVFALNIAVRSFTEPGDNVLIQRPVYNPFTQAVENNGRKVVSSSFIDNGNGTFSIDFESFEKLAQDEKTTMVILCSPHNPLGRIFTKTELTRMLDIAFENNLTVVVDEIHGDLIMPISEKELGMEHVAVNSLDKKYSDNVITCLSPSKTFNLAGTQWSGIVIPDGNKREKFANELDKIGYSQCNPFSIAAVVAAYEEGEEWLDEAISYIYDNYLYLKERLEEAFGDKVVVCDLQATYLAFVDFKPLGFTSERIENIILKTAKVALNSGKAYGKEADGYMRFNLATPRANIEEALDRIIDAFKLHADIPF